MKPACNVAVMRKPSVFAARPEPLISMSGVPA